MITTYEVAPWANSKTIAATCSSPDKVFHWKLFIDNIYIKKIYGPYIFIGGRERRREWRILKRSRSFAGRDFPMLKQEFSFLYFFLFQKTEYVYFYENSSHFQKRSYVLSCSHFSRILQVFYNTKISKHSTLNNSTTWLYSLPDLGSKCLVKKLKTMKKSWSVLFCNRIIEILQISTIT